MAVTDAVDKNLRPLINKLMFSGCSEEEAMEEYAAHCVQEMKRHRQIVAMRLVAELYNGRWEALKEEYVKALFLMDSGMEMGRRCRFLCLCLLMRGFRHFCGESMEELSEFVSSLFPDEFEGDGLPFT